ncbi:hypothetical protein ASL14_20690 [Paenibacillus sp. IHB B 3084]|uniref:hypothetical protein n=1 Tax=Paenibacillus sp. IHB B 3084 TaxID=867076 RepID=UPI000721C667|nr:hypothetical protein [Paenibacillus sp. IHB B 3084]ALP38229.1 hypothetical protein ASL14_20690 [Paenibacillus sp. IHB B 3084]
MHNSLEVLLDSLIRNRIESLYGELIKNNSSYDQFSSERNLYFKQLHELLSEDIQKTLFLFDDADLSVQTILEREIYLQGFKDALHLHNELDLSLD